MHAATEHVLIALILGTASITAAAVYGWTALRRTKTYIDAPDQESGSDTQG